MAVQHIVATSAGPVEVVRVPGGRPPVLFFPGGHCSAHCDCGWGLYTASGYGVVAFSRPGYGRTQVGALSPAEFAPLVRETCQQLGVTDVAAAVGVSFGGMQAVHVAADPALDVPRLIMHSCAPSRLPYPDSRAEAIGGRVVFSPPLQGVVWRLLHRFVRSDAGLRRMMARLSTLPVEDWWGEFTTADREEARAALECMRSDAGFTLDLRYSSARYATDRVDALRSIRCPTLVTGSPHDRGVSFAHARDLADSIADAVLAESDAPTHLFWIGPGRARLVTLIESFLADGRDSI